DDIFAAFRTLRTKGNSEMNSSQILGFYAGARVASLFVAVSLLLPAAAMAQSTGPKAGSLEARIQHLEDTQEIHDLLTSYGRLLDAHDLAGYSQLFAKNGEWV